MPGKMSAAVERALARVADGEKILVAAVKEGCHPSSIHRALAKERVSVLVDHASNASNEASNKFWARDLRAGEGRE